MGGLLDYTVSYLGQVIVIVISRPRSLTIVAVDSKNAKCGWIIMQKSRVA